MYAYMLKSTFIVLTKKRMNPLELLQYLFNQGYFEPVYSSFEEVLFDMYTNAIIDTSNKHKNMTDTEIFQYVKEHFSEYIDDTFVEDEFELPDEANAFLKAICVKLQDYKDREFDCSKLKLNNDMLTKEGVYDVRRVIQWEV